MLTVLGDYQSTLCCILAALFPFTLSLIITKIGFNAEFYFFSANHFFFSTFNTTLHSRLANGFLHLSARGCTPMPYTPGEHVDSLGPDYQYASFAQQPPPREWAPKAPIFFHTVNIYIPTVRPSSTIFVRLIDNNNEASHPLPLLFTAVVLGG